MVLVVQEACFLLLIKNNNQVSPLGSDLTFSRLVVVPLPKEEVVVGGGVVVSGGCAGGCAPAQGGGGGRWLSGCVTVCGGCAGGCACGCAPELGRGSPQRYIAHIFG